MGFEVRTERIDTTVVLTIDNPPVNALHPDVAAALHVAVRDIDGSDARCVVLTGAGRVFVAGGDIEHLRTLRRGEAEPYVLAVQAMQDHLGLLHQPVIAAVNGAALGGGSELALACDIRIAAENARFGFPEVTLGLIPGAGGTQNLPRLLPLGRAKRLLFTGERISAAEALALGLVDEVVPEGMALDAALELAARIGANAPLAVAAAKRAVNLGLQMSLTDGQRLEAGLFAGLVGTDDQLEGTSAFLEKRPPTFTGA